MAIAATRAAGGHGFVGARADSLPVATDFWTAFKDYPVVNANKVLWSRCVRR